MKTRPFDLIWISGVIVAGVATGWLIRGGATVVSQPPAEESITQSARRSASSSPRTQNKWLAFATQFSEISENERAAFQKNIAPQDRGAAIEALLAQGGPVGFDSKLEAMIDQLVSHWAEENFEAAWAWSRQLKGEGTQNFIASKLLDKLVMTDPERALSCYLELMQTNPSFESKVPEKVLAGAALKSAEDFLNFAGKFGLSWYPGDSCAFAKDFNFQQVADGIAELQRGDDRKLPVGFPQNFHEAWAEQDREAAFASFTGGAFERLGDFYNFLEGLEKHNPPEAVWDWVAEKIQNSEVSSKAIRRGLRNLDAVSFNGIIQALPDAASRDHFLMQIALEGEIVSRRDNVPSIAISAMSSAEVRLEAFSKMHQDDPGGEHDCPLDITKITDADLQAWQITRQQVEAIFSEPIKKSSKSE
jgi:hypothetical protein